MSIIFSSKVSERVLLTLTTVTALFHLAMILQLPTWLGVFVPHTSIKAVSLILVATLIVLIVDQSHQGEEDVSQTQTRLGLSLIDIPFWLALVASCCFVIFYNDTLEEYSFFGVVDTTGSFFALCLAIPLLEFVRRRTGIVLPIIILTFVGIAMFQKFLPGVLNGRGYSLDRLLFSSFVGDAGIFGKPFGIAVNIVIVFLIFGALMERAGASSWFMDLAMALTGRSRGGPAKAAVAASAMFGSISGSPSGNSATTGVFTIPMMIEVGYKRKFAAAVEAVASTGGMILPPVMGAIAFLMAEWIDMPYTQVVIAALIPAILYYVIVFASVHFEARRSGIEAMPAKDVPNFFRTLRSGWYYGLPMLALVYFLLIASYPPQLAGIYSCGVVIACSFLSKNRENWMLPMSIVLALKFAVLRWLVIAVITAAVGIMIGALELSGVGLNVSRFIVDLAGGNLLATLILVGIVSLIMGMGLDATPAYVTLASLMAPALIQMGVPPIAAHLYVVYWGLASFFTPPTCIAIFVTAPIAGAGVWESGWEAVRLGIAAFLIPIAFALNPSLLMIGTPTEIIVDATTALIGALAVAGGLRGFALAHMNYVQRIAMTLGGLLLISPGLREALFGLALTIFALIYSVVAERKASNVKA